MSRVPGTFKNKPPQHLIEMGGAEARAVVAATLAAGSLYARAYWLGHELRVIVSHDPTSRGLRWHLSISHASRYPTWDEIKTARYLATELEDVEVMAQLLPKINDESEWVNTHDNVFHLHEIKEV
jgi:hypothetical protein